MQQHHQSCDRAIVDVSMLLTGSNSAVDPATVLSLMCQRCWRDVTALSIMQQHCWSCKSAIVAVRALSTWCDSAVNHVTVLFLMCRRCWRDAIALSTWCDSAVDPVTVVLSMMCRHCWCDVIALSRAVKSNQNRIVFCYQIKCFCSDGIESHPNQSNGFFDFRYDSIRFDLDKHLDKKNVKLRQGKWNKCTNRILKEILRYLCLYSGQFLWQLSNFLMANFLSWKLMHFCINSNRFMNQINIESKLNRIERFPQHVDQKSNRIETDLIWQPWCCQSCDSAIDRATVPSLLRQRCQPDLTVLSIMRQCPCWCVGAVEVTPQRCQSCNNAVDHVTVPLLMWRHCWCDATALLIMHQCRCCCVGTVHVVWQCCQSCDSAVLDVSALLTWCNSTVNMMRQCCCSCDSSAVIDV